MRTIYLDESGYTGDDLLNPDQRFFVVASSLIDDEEADAILRRSFPRYQGDEFKFSNVWRRPSHRGGLRGFASEIPAIADRLFLYVIDKRFCLLTKMLDYLIEPTLAERFDFYKDGYAQRFMNSCHRDILEQGGEALYETSITRWDSFARSPDASTLASLEQHLELVANSAPAPTSMIYKMALKGLQSFKAAYAKLDWFNDTSEIQLTTVFSTVIRWRQQFADDIALVHDESSNFLRQRDMWATMLRDDFASPSMPVGNGTLIEFPLRVRSTTSMASHLSPAIQLCDIVAGLGAKLNMTMQGRDRDPFLMELVGRGAGELTQEGVKPYAEYAEGPPPPRVGPDMVDRMVELLAPELERRAAARDASGSSAV
jgi:hypothetical protein